MFYVQKGHFSLKVTLSTNTHNCIHTYSYIYKYRASANWLGSIIVAIPLMRKNILNNIPEVFPTPLSLLGSPEDAMSSWPQADLLYLAYLSLFSFPNSFFLIVNNSSMVWEFRYPWELILFARYFTFLTEFFSL